MTHVLARRVMLVVLGLSYLAAFASLAVQVRGLIGSDGIQPAAQFLERVANQHGTERFWWVPTLFWLDSSDGMLLGLCLTGVVLAGLLVVGVAPVPVLVGLWAAYLSLQQVGGVFLRFQWDALLLEAGFLAIFLAPPGWRPGLGLPRPPSRWIVFLFHLLLFRLMFSSGAVKLLSGDLSWRAFTALPVHYETQPLPTSVGWWAYWLPEWVHPWSVGIVLAIELAVPWLIWLGTTGRRLAFLPLVGFQVVIFATGNYGFFNLLTIGLCVLLLDDATWPRRWRPTAGKLGSPWPAWVVAPLVGIVMLGTGVQLAAAFGESEFWPPGVRRVSTLAGRFGIVNGYGLFAVMTTERPELVIEGSSDGRNWRSWELPWKPGNPGRAPAFVAPHMPRLDWQLWFAALSQPRENPWFLALLLRLLEGSPPVRGLFATDPFPVTPPRYVRARLERYRFAPPDASEWWRRAPAGIYVPPVSLPKSTSSRSRAATNVQSASRKSSPESEPTGRQQMD